MSPGARLSTDRIVALDGLRGVAALLVAFYHFTFTRTPSHGYLAVDLFFMLSGFVLAAVYEERFRAGMTFGEFMTKRLARLYPVYLAGVLIAFAMAPAHLGLGDATRALALNLVFLPDIGAPATHFYWLDPPTWSLSLEMMINVVVGLGAWRLSTRALGVVVLIGLALYLRAALAFGPQVGNREGLDYVAGWARLLFGFPLGWLIWRLRDRLKALASGWASYAALAVLVLAFCAPGDVAAIVTTILIFPLALTLIALGPQPSGRLAKAAAIAGALSYPLYVVHMMVAQVTLSLPLGVAIAAAASIALAWAIHRSVEPMGRRLVLRLAERRPAAAGAAA